MADTHASASYPNAQATTSGQPSQPGTWQTVEQASVSLGLSVRTVNRHISAQKLTSRLMDGRREVFVPDPDLAVTSSSATDTPTADNAVSAGHAGHCEAPQSSGPSATVNLGNPPPSGVLAQDADQPKVKSDSFLDLDTALAMADKMGERKADRQVELAVSAYQSLTRSIETQAQSAKRIAAVAWCIVGVLSIGVTVALVWTACRVTKAESDSQHLKEQADIDLQRMKAQANLDADQLKERVDEAQRRADTQEKDLADIRQKLSEAQERAARAEGRAAVYQEMLPSSRPATRPTLIDRLTTAFGTGQ